MSLSTEAQGKNRCFQLLLITLILAVYGQTLSFEFVNYDDNIYVTENPLVTRGLTFDGVQQAFLRWELGLWNPLVTISHMVDCELYGANAGGYHWTNVLWHLLTSLLLFAVLLEMTGKIERSFFVAALFAVHPLRVETVAWISDRKDVLGGFFFVLTLLLYVRYVRQPNRFRYGLILLSFLAGLMARGILVTLPAVLFLLDAGPLQRLFRSEPNRSWWGQIQWRVVWEKIPFFLLAIGAFSLTWLAPVDPQASLGAIEQVPVEVRLWQVPLSLLIYVGQFFYPLGLTIIYPTLARTSVCGLVALVFLLGLTGLFFWARRKHPLLWTGWLWNLVMLLPVCGWVLDVRHSLHWRVDHYNYLPQIGLGLALTWTVAEWSQRWRNRRFLLMGMATGSILILSGLAYRQTATWRNDLTLWTQALRLNPQNPVAHNNLGVALFQQGQKRKAEIHYRAALDLNANFDEARNNLGVTLFEQGRYDEAVGEYRVVLQHQPYYARAHANLGNALSKLGQKAEAGKHYREALRLKPELVKSYPELQHAEPVPSGEP